MTEPGQPLRGVWVEFAGEPKPTVGAGTGTGAAEAIPTLPVAFDWCSPIFSEEGQQVVPLTEDDLAIWAVVVQNSLKMPEENEIRKEEGG
eukprot:11206238-Lingulodinium_polyedra.AAC.1